NLGRRPRSRRRVPRRLEDGRARRARLPDRPALARDRAGRRRHPLRERPRLRPGQRALRRRDAQRRDPPLRLERRRARSGHGLRQCERSRQARRLPRPGRNGVRRGRQSLRRRLRPGRRHGPRPAGAGRAPDRDAGERNDQRLLRVRRVGGHLRHRVRARPPRAVRRRRQGLPAVDVTVGELTRYERLHGRDIPPVERTELTAGPLVAELEAPDLRYVAAGDLELLRRLFVAVRDRNWGTVPPELSNVELIEADGGFVFRYDAHYADAALGIDFSTHGEIAGASDGTLTCTLD